MSLITPFLLSAFLCLGVSKQTPRYKEMKTFSFYESQSKNTTLWIHNNDHLHLKVISSLYNSTVKIHLCLNKPLKGYGNLVIFLRDHQGFLIQREIFTPEKSHYLNKHYFPPIELTCNTQELKELAYIQIAWEPKECPECLKTWENFWIGFIHGLEEFNRNSIFQQKRYLYY